MDNPKEFMDNTSETIDDFIISLADPQVQEDTKALILLLEKISGFPPKVVAKGMIGFGTYTYKYASGHQGVSFLVGFAPRKNKFSLYLNSDHSAFTDELSKLGKYKSGKGCLYISKLSDINQDVLEILIRKSIDFIKTTYAPYNNF